MSFTCNARVRRFRTLGCCVKILGYKKLIQHISDKTIHIHPFVSLSSHTGVSGQLRIKIILKYRYHGALLPDNGLPVPDNSLNGVVAVNGSLPVFFRFSDPRLLLPPFICVYVLFSQFLAVFSTCAAIYVSALCAVSSQSFPSYSALTGFLCSQYHNRRSEELSTFK